MDQKKEVLLTNGKPCRYSVRHCIKGKNTFKKRTFLLYSCCQLKVLSFIEIVIHRFNSILIIIQYFLTQTVFKEYHYILVSKNKYYAFSSEMT